MLGHAQIIVPGLFAIVISKPFSSLPVYAASGAQASPCSVAIRSMCCSPQRHSGSKAAFSEAPNSVAEYSTCGGIS
jgi:hypothetical protein